MIAANGKHAQGLVRAEFVFCDEPGAWETIGGQLMHEALTTAQGKPGVNLRVIYLGTLAPARGGWWHELTAAGSTASTHVTSLQGDPATWDRAATIRKCNPLMWAFPESRRVLLDERDAARLDTRKKSAFLSYRLNVPTADESTVLLTVAEWERICARPVAEREGRPVVGVDLARLRLRPTSM